jgi:hypothetical protein
MLVLHMWFWTRKVFVVQCCLVKIRHGDGKQLMNDVEVRPGGYFL